MKRGFGEVFEGKKPGAGIPQVTLRRLTPEEVAAANLPADHTVGIFHGDKAVAYVDFDDFFDEDGNYFIDD